MLYDEETECKGKFVCFEAGDTSGRPILQPFNTLIKTAVYSKTSFPVIIGIFYLTITDFVVSDFSSLVDESTKMILSIKFLLAYLLISCLLYTSRCV